ncbi:MAG TPA: EF-hand domain-containing protein [Noviherbaspirillum sp.]|nr:EF-hand domain-containing protein [Noviherbaspirillum sp.]
MKAVSLLFVLIAAIGMAHAQTIVPKLDQEGRKGDMARLAHKQAQDKFNAADADKDNRISPEEASKTLPYVAEHFERYDKDKDGFLTWEEFVGHNRWKKD